MALPASSRSEEDPVQAGGGDERRRREGDRARAREREREKEEGTGTVQPQSDVGGDEWIPSVAAGEASLRHDESEMSSKRSTAPRS